MKFWKTVPAAILSIVLILGAAGASAAPNPETPQLEFEKFILSNGLEVILHEDHSAPIVSVNIWYHVGSKNEKKGRTGFAHLFEHLMFEGSANVPEGSFDKWLEAAGGDNNGSTTEDRTNYWESAPSDALELALFLEADRMATLLETIDLKKLDGQREVVKNERRQGVDNRPYGKAEEVILQALYPSDHPYSWSVIGSLDDLDAATVEDVQQFFRTYYAPNNASLAIAGDIDPVKTRQLVEKYFASIPPGPPVDRIQDWIPTLDGEKLVELKDRVSLPRLYINWHSPALFQPGDADLDLLSSILSGGKNSRLYKRLVYEDQIAQDVEAYQYSREIAGTFTIEATAKPGHTLEELKTAIDEELAMLRDVGVRQAELTSALNEWEASLLRSLQSVGGFRGKADRLNSYNTFAGTPGYLEADMARYYGVTLDSLQATAKRILVGDRRVILKVEPAGDLAAVPAPELDRTQVPASAGGVALRLPDVSQFQLPNGLKVLLVEHQELPLVQLNLVVDGGWTADPVDRPGLSRLTSDLLDEGTASRNALELAEQVKSLGLRLSSNSSFDSATISLNSLRRHLPAGLEIIADLLLNPTFPEAELERKKQEYLAQILVEESEPFTVGLKSFFKLLYGEGHPYAQPFTGTGTRESLEQITRNELVSYFDTYFRPNNSTLIVVGAVSQTDITPLLEEKLKNWKSQPIPEILVPDRPLLAESAVYVIDKPGAAQSVLIAGHEGILRTSPDFPATELANTILGAKFTSRLNSNLREDKGYTYGSRSYFSSRKSRGPFFAYAQVQTEVTREALTEMVKELKGIRGEIPITEEELQDTKNYITLGYPQEFETIGQLALKLVDVVNFGLPLDYFASYVEKIRSVSLQEAEHAAEVNIRPSRMLFIIVGDSEKIRPGIEAMELGPLHLFDMKGNRVSMN
ncbi:MAG: insulinase family protein [Acidobacteriota bacterium]|nr:MAG: insulinase family protein [Acidobacteriota bacterium]